jgi:hypothetical protein
VEENRRLYHGTPYDKRNWYTYGAVIYAPGDGKVVAAANDVPDNEFDGTRIVSRVLHTVSPSPGEQNDECRFGYS